jgi:hypothetical protein
VFGASRAGPPVLRGLLVHTYTDPLVAYLLHPAFGVVPCVFTFLLLIYAAGSVCVITRVG